MIRQDTFPEIVIPEELLITDEMFAEWQSSISKVAISDEVCSIVSNIRKLFKEEEKKQEHAAALDFYISDRRWKKLFKLMRTSAWLNGRTAIDETDCILLIHCLWNKSEYIPQTIECVLKAFTLGIEQLITRLHARIDKAIKENFVNKPARRMSEDDSSNDYVVERYFYYVINGYPKGKCLFAKVDLNHLSAEQDTNGIVYWDTNIRNWIIHAIYMGTPFSNKVSSSGKVEKILLRKCKGGVLINGIPYVFQRRSGWNSISNSDKQFDIQPNENESFIQFQVEYSKISSQFKTLSDRISNCNNLFVADDDKRLLSKQIKTIEKSLNELYIKLNNSHTLLQ